MQQNGDFKALVVPDSERQEGARVDAARLAADAEARASGARVARSAGIVSLAVLGSRLLGLVREQVMAAYFGAGFLTDAFNVGFRIPNILRDLFAEGALSIAFVKTFTEYERERGEGEAWRLASLVLNAFAISMSLAVVIGVLFAPQIVSVLARGFTPEKTQLAVDLTRIMLFFLPLVALAAVAMGVLNSKSRFGVPASASTLFNVGAIVGGLAFAYTLSGGAWDGADSGAVPGPAAQRAITGMACGTLFGGLLQFLLQVPSLRNINFKFRLVVSFRDPGVRRVLKLMALAVIGTASVQLNVFINTIYASSIEGGISWLNFAFRLLQFPIGLFGVALGTATLPTISRFAARGDVESFRRTLASSIGLVFFLTVPSACGLIVLGRPMIRLIYERGQFRAFDTEMVALAVAAYAVGLMGYAALKVLSPAFFALNDARTPLIVSLSSIGLNAALSFALYDAFSLWGVTPLTPHGYGHVGLALSTSCVTLANFLVLALIMRRKLCGLDGRRIISSLWRIAVAAVALSVASYYSHIYFSSLFVDDSLLARLAETFLPTLVGGGIFVWLARLLRIPELDQALSILPARFFRGSRQA